MKCHRAFAHHTREPRSQNLYSISSLAHLFTLSLFFRSSFSFLLVLESFSSSSTTRKARNCRSIRHPPPCIAATLKGAIHQAPQGHHQPAWKNINRITKTHM